jgi:hypothetical protein
MTTVRLCVLMATLLVAAPALAAPSTAPPGNSTTPKADTPPRRVAEPPPARDEGKPPPDSTADDSSAPPAEATKPPPDEAGTPKEMTPPIKKKNLSHKYQVSVDISVAVGGAFLVTYEDTTWCGKGSPDTENESFCTGLAPVAMDFGLGFSVLRYLEIVAEFRLGMMRDIVGNHPRIFMPGVRLWIDPKLPFKIGLALQMVFDLTKQDSTYQVDNLPPNGQKLDLGFRFYAQFQYDFLRYLGLFGRIGLASTFKKWIGFNLEASFGVQARFP